MSGSSVRRSFFPFPPHRDLLVVDVQVFHSESKGLQKPQGGAVEQVSDETVWPVHLVQERRHLRLHEHHRKPLGLLSSVEPRHLIPLGAEYVAVEKQQGIQGLVLRRGGHVSIHGEVGQVFSDLVLSNRARMTGVVVFDVADDPAEIGLFGPVRVAVSATGRPDAIDERR